MQVEELDPYILCVCTACEHLVKTVVTQDDIDMGDDTYGREFVTPYMHICMHIKEDICTMEPCIAHGCFHMRDFTVGHTGYFV